MYNNAIIVKMSLLLSHPYEPKSEWLLQAQYKFMQPRSYKLHKNLFALSVVRPRQTSSSDRQILSSN